MDYYEVVEKRRSIRRFSDRDFPDESVSRALDAALLAPNSSNVQTWDFYWIKDLEIRKKVVFSCLDQSAARTAKHLIVVTADASKWRRSQFGLIQWAKDSKAPKAVLVYYEKIIPFVYRWGFLNCLAPFKWLVSNIYGLAKPVPRGPYGRRGVSEVAIKSAALAAENLVLAITAEGGASCMMEGFDERRLGKVLKLSSTTRVVMVIGIGHEAERGTWGSRYRLNRNDVIHVV